MKTPLTKKAELVVIKSGAIAFLFQTEMTTDKKLKRLLAEIHEITKEEEDNGSV